MTNVILGVHIALGSISVLVGLTCLTVQKRKGPHTLLGELYHLVVLIAVASGLVLAFDPFDPGLIAIGLLTYAFTVVAYVAAKHRFSPWLWLHAPCMITSVFFLVEAAVITNWDVITMGYGIPNGWAWLLPALFFYPAIGITLFRIRQRRYVSS